MNVDKSIQTLGETGKLLTEKKAAYHGQLLVASSALFGILISLHTTTSSTLFVRLTFAAAVVLLSLGILLIAVATYHQVDAINRARKLYMQEAIQSLREDRDTEPVAAPERKIFLFATKAAYICFAGAVLLLAAYSVLLAFD